MQKIIAKLVVCLLIQNSLYGASTSLLVGHYDWLLVMGVPAAVAFYLVYKRPSDVKVDLIADKKHDSRAQDLFDYKMHVKDTATMKLSRAYRACGVSLKTAGIAAVLYAIYKFLPINNL
jgi:hypothetical protein